MTLSRATQYRGVMLNRVALIEFRKRAGLSPSQLALQAGVSLSYLCEVEKGTKTNVSAPVIARLAEELKVPIPAILACPPVDVEVG